MAWKGSTALRLEMEINGRLLGHMPDICRKARGITMERLDKAVQKSHSAGKHQALGWAKAGLRDETPVVEDDRRQQGRGTTWP
jgi:hypothetical protein